jgi:gamma-glutamyltranspeptidase/glutathione hydrolase
MQHHSAWREKAGTWFDTEKSPVTGTHGVVTANHPLGSTAGIEMLAMGGNAIDAAIATLFTLTVVEPMMVGFFGAGWTNIRHADGTSLILDNYSTAPAAATPDLFTPVSDTWPDYMETAVCRPPLSLGLVNRSWPWVRWAACGSSRVSYKPSLASLITP